MTDKHETHLTKTIHKRSTAFEGSVRKLLEGFNMFDGTNLTLISDVDNLPSVLISKMVLHEFLHDATI